MDIAGNILDLKKFKLDPRVDAELLRLGVVLGQAGYEQTRLCYEFNELTLCNIFTTGHILHSLVNVGGAWCERGEILQGVIRWPQ